jgi:hydrogenase expression/formation protein HypE
MSEQILLDDGSGGKASQRLIHNLFIRYFANEMLAPMDDAALLHISGPIAMSTDGYTVDPVEFPGGNIGSLAVHGTVNDVSMLGARPKFLSAAFILEEGLDRDLLERIVRAMAEAAQEAGVFIVTGDTKVVPRGTADKIFITTTGIGEIITHTPPSGANAKPGDVVLISGTMGDHGLTILAQREGLSLSSDVKSDCASLNRMAEALVTGLPHVHVLRDPTRGGLATTLNEIAAQSGVAIILKEKDLPVRPEVAAGCAVLGLEPLYLANEGKLLCVVPEQDTDMALAIMRRFPQGEECAMVARVYDASTTDALLPAMKAGQVLLETGIGGHRLLGMLEGEQLPRIC